MGRRPKVNQYHIVGYDFPKSALGGERKFGCAPAVCSGCGSDGSRVRTPALDGHKSAR